MQHDDVIWGVIGTDFCSFKVKTPDSGRSFCRNEYNVTGLCDRKSCPLANSQYATIRELDGVCRLFVKAVERVHSPARLWEQIELSNDRQEALLQIRTRLKYWPGFIVEKCEKRVKKILEYLEREKQVGQTPDLNVFKQKSERRLRKRELKAEQTARLDQSIEKELLERLKCGLYGDIYNIPQDEFDQMLEKVGQDEFVEDELSDYEQGLEYDTEHDLHTIPISK